MTRAELDDLRYRIARERFCGPPRPERVAPPQWLGAGHPHPDAVTVDTAAALVDHTTELREAAEALLRAWDAWDGGEDVDAIGEAADELRRVLR